MKVWARFKRYKVNPFKILCNLMLELFNTKVLNMLKMFINNLSPDYKH